MLGFSLYPHHLNGNSNCKLDNFCEMVARTAEIMDVKNLGIGSDLCLNQPDEIVEWMRNGTWTKKKVYGEGTVNNVGFQNNLVGLKMLEDLKILRVDLKKLDLVQMKLMGYWETTGIIFTKVLINAN